MATVGGFGVPFGTKIVFGLTPVFGVTFGGGGGTAMFGVGVGTTGDVDTQRPPCALSPGPQHSRPRTRSGGQHPLARFTSPRGQPVVGGGGAQRPSLTCPLGQHPLASLTSPSGQPSGVPPGGSGVGVSIGGGGTTGGGVGAGGVIRCGGETVGSQFAPLTISLGGQHRPLDVTWVARQQ